jgi:hypothetical protein
MPGRGRASEILDRKPRKSDRTLLRSGARYRDRQDVRGSGKSGLNLNGGDALKQLIDDVQSKKADFNTILVSDVMLERAAGGLQRDQFLRDWRSGFQRKGRSLSGTIEPVHRFSCFWRIGDIRFVGRVTTPGVPL